MAGGYSVLTARTSRVIFEGMLTAIFKSIEIIDIAEHTIVDIDSSTELQNTAKCVSLSSDYRIELDELSSEHIYADIVFSMLKSDTIEDSSTTIFTCIAIDSERWFGVRVTAYGNELTFTASPINVFKKG